jgi:FixJ family two-component response regulator
LKFTPEIHAAMLDDDAMHAPAAPRTLNVLLIEDSEDDAMLLLHRFRLAGYQVWAQRVEDERSLREALASRTWDVVLSDHNMPRFSAMVALSILQGLGLDLPFIIVSGVIEEDIAVSAMRAGAHDYLSKGKLDRLIPAVEREMREARNRAERHSALDAVRMTARRASAPSPPTFPAWCSSCCATTTEAGASCSSAKAASHCSDSRRVNWWPSHGASSTWCCPRTCPNWNGRCTCRRTPSPR